MAVSALTLIRRYLLQATDKELNFLAALVSGCLVIKAYHKAPSWGLSFSNKIYKLVLVRLAYMAMCMQMTITTMSIDGDTCMVKNKLIRDLSKTTTWFKVNLKGANPRNFMQLGKNIFP